MGIVAPSANHLVRLITDQGNNHAVEVEEEHQEMETELDEGFLYVVSCVHPEILDIKEETHPLVNIELAENLGCVQKVLVVEDPSKG